MLLSLAHCTLHWRDRRFVDPASSVLYPTSNSSLHRKCLPLPHVNDGVNPLSRLVHSAGKLILTLQGPRLRHLTTYCQSFCIDVRYLLGAHDRFCCLVKSAGMCGGDCDVAIASVCCQFVRVFDSYVPIYIFWFESGMLGIYTAFS
jgi:hypothetical protein